VLEKNTPNCGNYGTFHKFVDLWDIAYAYYIGHEKPTHILKKKKILPHNYKLLHHFQEKSNESRQKEETKTHPPTHQAKEGPLPFAFF
jgi:hypothetical protein